jgi:hypothetical protein
MAFPGRDFPFGNRFQPAILVDRYRNPFTSDIVFVYFSSRDGWADIGEKAWL